MEGSKGRPMFFRSSGFNDDAPSGLLLSLGSKHFFEEVFEGVAAVARVTVAGVVIVWRISHCVSLRTIVQCAGIEKPHAHKGTV